MPATPFYDMGQHIVHILGTSRATHHHVEPRNPTSLEGKAVSIGTDHGFVGRYLFVLLVKHRNDEDQGRSNAAL